MPDRKPLTQHGFLELPVTRDLSEARADVAILGVPYDLATTGRSGTREGPQGVRRASWQLSWEARRWPWRFALADRLSVIDYGDVIFDPGNNQQMVEVLQQDARTLLAAGKTILSLGGTTTFRCRCCESTSQYTVRYRSSTSTLTPTPSQSKAPSITAACFERR